MMEERRTSKIRKTKSSDASNIASFEFQKKKKKKVKRNENKKQFRFQNKKKYPSNNTLRIRIERLEGNQCRSK